MDLQPTSPGAADAPASSLTAEQRHYAAAGLPAAVRPRPPMISAPPKLLEHYMAYGLRFASELALGEVPAAYGEAPPDVTLRIAAIPRAPLPVAEDANGAFAPEGDAVYFCYPRAGKFLVRGGREIVIEPGEGVDAATLRFFALGVASGLLLHQRGALALHSSAVALGGGAVAFLGESGEGKSTLAAFLHRRGHSLVADDILAVADDGRPQPHVLPSFPQLKLWPDAVAGLGGDPAGLPGLMGGSEKLAYRPERRFLSEALPLRRIYILAHGERPSLEPLGPQQALVELVRNTYALRFIGSAGATPAHMGQCARLARAVPVALLRRPYDFAAFAEVADLIERDAAGEARP